MNISGAAKAAGLPVKTVRYYADIGLVQPAARTAAGYRDSVMIDDKRAD